MRQSLLNSFDQIYILDLHGNTKKQEVAPDGSKDDNVFDIEQGVAIAIFVKLKDAEQGLWRGDLQGRRLAKYQLLSHSTLADRVSDRLAPASPRYMFLAQDAVVGAEHDGGYSVRDIFGIGSVGIVTARDDFALAHSAEDLWNRVRDLASIDIEKLRAKYVLGRDTRDWSVAMSQADVLFDGPNRDFIRTVQYRPFDQRMTYFTVRSRGFLSYPREDIWNRLGGGNLSLITSRFTKGEDFAHAMVSEGMVEKIALSSKTSNNAFIFPLLLDAQSEAENLTPAFRDFLDDRYGEHYDPEQILGYIYAVLHAPTYRTRYAEFLRIDFPRIPFAETPEQFEALSVLGWELIQTHLLKTVPRSDPRLGDYVGKGDHTIEAVRYSPQEQTVWINKTQGFANLPQSVWDFHIGGYQVIDKYLKSRKGRVLNLDEQTHVGNIAESLNFTLGQMARIDAAYQDDFPDQAGG